MPALSRLTVVCVLALLQIGSASGHVLHHALEGTGPEHLDCADAACGMDRDSAAPCHHNSDADPPSQHDCSDCFLCDASDAQVVAATQTQRPLEGVVAASCPMTGAVEFDASGDSARRLPPVPPPPRPATLHAIELPLLD